MFFLSTKPTSKKNRAVVLLSLSSFMFSANKGEKRTQRSKQELNLS